MTRKVIYVRKDIYGIYVRASSKQVRCISNLAIDDQSLTNAAGGCHRATPGWPVMVATTCDDIYGIYGRGRGN
jgi:hypothetical protein